MIGGNVIKNWQHNSGKDKKGKGTCKGRLRARKESLRQLKNRYKTSQKREVLSYIGHIRNEAHDGLSRNQVSTRQTACN